jgi:hypothetical protein
MLAKALVILIAILYAVLMYAMVTHRRPSPNAAIASILTMLVLYAILVVPWIIIGPYVLYFTGVNGETGGMSWPNQIFFPPAIPAVAIALLILFANLKKKRNGQA